VGVRAIALLVPLRANALQVRRSLMNGEATFGAAFLQSCVIIASKVRPAPPPPRVSPVAIRGRRVDAYTQADCLRDPDERQRTGCARRLEKTRGIAEKYGIPVVTWESSTADVEVDPHRAAAQSTELARAIASVSPYSHRDLEQAALGIRACADEAFAKQPPRNRTEVGRARLQASAANRLIRCCPGTAPSAGAGGGNAAAGRLQ
jgi:hypothetical protein